MVTNLARFQQPMRVLADRGRDVDIRAFELAPFEQVAADLQPVTLALLGDVRALLGDVLATCEQAGLRCEAAPVNAFLPFEHAIDASMQNLRSHEAVDEIAFVAQLELRQREQRLARVVVTRSAVALLGECDSSLRRVRKALAAVDAAIARFEHVAPLLDYTSELQTSLEVRRAYAKFRSRLMVAATPSADELKTRLRGVGTQIAILIGWHAYTDMRVQDRLLLRDLQRRILDWLRNGDDANPAAGLRVWQDLASCAEMFGLVSRRQELVDHDRAVVAAAARKLAKDVSESELAALVDELRALEGLDPELDATLEAPTPQALHAIIRRLSRRFEESRASAAPAEGDLAW